MLTKSFKLCAARPGLGAVLDAGHPLGLQYLQRTFWGWQGSGTVVGKVVGGSRRGVHHFRRLAVVPAKSGVCCFRPDGTQDRPR